MIDAKRLAELMKPEKLTELADYLDTINRYLDKSSLAYDIDKNALDGAAAVLREVAKNIRQ